MKKERRALFLATGAVAACIFAASCSSGSSAHPAAASAPAPAPETLRTDISRIAAKIRTADYEGNRPALMALYEEMAPYTQGPLASRALYWRGFAMWRRALNGFNDNATNEELAEDLKRCIDELARASLADPQFVDAKVGEASCIVNLAVISSGEERKEGYRRHREILDEAKKMAPENPRLAWVLGATLWYSPPQIGGGQDKAFETYQQGLVWARKEHVTDPLDPAWGEPELLMNLAFASLNATTPDLEAADRYAHEALKLVPNWHYVRDILIPQIQAAREKAHASG
jgi:hypothetical protein